MAVKKDSHHMSPRRVNRSMGSSKQAMKPNGAPKNVPNPNGARKKVHKPIVAPAKATESITTPTKAHTPTTTHGKPDTETAAQRALSIPDILGQIFEAIAKRWGQKCTVLETGATVYHLWPHARMTLSRCARVNTIWFCESTRLLWQYPDFRYLNNLSLLLRRVSPARINLYAASVQLGFMAPLSLNRLPEENNALDGVVFSRIRLLRLHLWTHSGSPDGVKFFLPLIQGPALEVLEIDPYSLTYKPYINRKVGFELARRCRNLFPSLRKIVFVRYAFTSRATKDFFAALLHGVQVVWSGYKGSGWRRGWPKRRITDVKEVCA